MTDWSEAPPMDLVLRKVVIELESHAASSGWDQPGRLFALVDTADLIAREPDLAKAMGLPADDDGLSAVEQDELPTAALEEALTQIVWPPEVAGCAVVVERFVLPPTVEAEIPADDAEALAFAAAHPDRQEVRIVAGVTRAGSTFCALRMRAHDDEFSVLEGQDLVPSLLELLLTTLVPEPQADRQDT